MGNLKNVIYLSRQNYKDLINNGQVTVNGVTVQYSDDDIHIAPLNIETLTEAEKQKARELIGAVAQEYVDDKLQGISYSKLYHHTIKFYAITDGNEGYVYINFLDYNNFQYGYAGNAPDIEFELAVLRCINPIFEDVDLTFSYVQYKKIIDFHRDSTSGDWYITFVNSWFEEVRFSELRIVDYIIEQV